MKTVNNLSNKERNSFIVCLVLFILFIYGLCSFYYKVFFLWSSDNSLFIPSRSFFLQTMQEAGGLLNYNGLFLTQFFCYPLLGSAILLLLLIVVCFLMIKAFELPAGLYPIAFIPALALLLSVTQMGYMIHTLKSPGYIFSNTLGIIVCLLFCWGCKNLLKKNRFLHYFMPIIIVSTYPLFGIYSLFTAFLVFFMVVFLLKTPLKTSIILFLIYLSTGLVIPWLFVRFIFSEMPWHNTFIAGLPKFYCNLVELPLWIPFIVLFVSLSLFTLVFKYKNKIQGKRNWYLFSTGIFIFMLTSVYLLSYRNSNFITELKMLNAIEKSQWEQVVHIREKHDDKPTRLIIMFYNLALFKLGLAGDRMFTMDNKSVLHDFYRKNMILINYGAKPLYFHYGKINYCYRWCMEDMVEYGMTVTGLKYMVKCALLNNEFALAKKYNDVLKQTIFHKKWAESYQPYIDDPQQLTKNSELNAIRPLTAYENQLDRDKYQLEFYILNNFARMRGGTPELVDLSLQCNLIIKNVQRFWPRFFLYASTHERIPVHYQEAALLYSYLEREVDLSQFKFDKEVLDNFDRLVAMSKQYAENPDEKNEKIFKPLFGKTFWYYYFFVTDVKSN